MPSINHDSAHHQEDHHDRSKPPRLHQRRLEPSLVKPSPPAGGLLPLFLTGGFRQHPAREIGRGLLPRQRLLELFFKRCHVVRALLSSTCWRSWLAANPT